ncbi:OmpA family protein [Cypionkella sp.]|uniref:OmpA family protein n=1 Tax=Cypionkella sp. TaxID=2811411 RepID=UPI002AC8FD7B|nr:OmpA family protein [Cypionkella sp.]
MEKTAFRVACALVAATFAALPASAAPLLALQFPGPSETTLQRAEALASFRLAVGPFQDGKIATQLTEGNLEQSAWRIADPDISTLAMTQSLRSQIAAAGYKVIFECETEACGGYDFRYGTEILPEPDMHVDLGDFRYIAAERAGPLGVEYLGLIVSRSPDTGFVQLTRIGGAATPQVATSTKTPEPAKPGTFALKPAPVAAAPDDLGAALDLGQSKVLEDLVFSSGTSTLSEGEYASLSALAAWLKANPQQVAMLVGHTDASGGLAGNTALSKKRAESVRQTLLTRYGVAAAQITANGVGPLAPRASNQTAEGQQQNRRVEVVPTSTPE